MSTQHCVSYVAPVTEASKCADLLKCLSPGSIPPNALPPTSNLVTWDALTNTITSNVNGATSSVSLASLDDEGVKLQIVAGNLELVNKAGAVIGSTPIVDKDGQILSLPSKDPTVLEIAISNGNSVKVDCGIISGLYPSETKALPLKTSEFLSSDCKRYSLELMGKTIVSTFGLTPTTCASITALYAPASNPNFSASVMMDDCQRYTLKSIGAAIVGAFNLASTAQIQPVTCATIAAAYPAPSSAGAAFTGTLLTAECLRVKTVRAVSSLGTPLNYYVIPV